MLAAAPEASAALRLVWSQAGMSSFGEALLVHAGMQPAVSRHHTHRSIYQPSVRERICDGIHDVEDRYRGSRDTDVDVRMVTPRQCQFQVASESYLELCQVLSPS